MMKKKYFPWICLLASLTFFTTACNEDEVAPGSVTLHFDHSLGGQDLELDQLKYLSEAGHVYSVINLRYYISGIILHGSDGNSFNADEIHYRDIHDPSTRSLLVSEVPNGHYTSLSFIFGLDEVKNVDGGLENTVENINMEWPIPGDQGYHYMKLEGRYDSLGAGVIKNYNLHTGAAGGNQNYLRLTFPLPDVNIQSNSWIIPISMDINEWLQNPQTYDFEEWGPMIMMNQNAQEILKANGVTVFTVGNVTKD